MDQQNDDRREPSSPAARAALGRAFRRLAKTYQDDPEILKMADSLEGKDQEAQP
ncbi:hypothetical protein GVO57_06280 [Sphingomonas changnyeongensis]|uniref:Uncharacterized protein n=1 Tax=Sphingomonas changnyeongensis TaxID=2698679 RepID=A0A7Z2NW99_9SPHN|nr:hypothetical protein [Sphingomonas changnyeongensis]QHL90520.1 hypothetical protein GVO57_06280 [Sphingomonas changnyeongensis]